ncbi:unnamed protein product [Lampetra fluviatilis]
MGPPLPKLPETTQAVARGKLNVRNLRTTSPKGWNLNRKTRHTLELCGLSGPFRKQNGGHVNGLCHGAFPLAGNWMLDRCSLLHRWLFAVELSDPALKFREVSVERVALFP